MLTILRGKPKPLRYATFDLEWRTDTLELRLLGLMTARDRYRAFYSIEEFLNHVIHRDYSGYRFYAHFGGRFDIVFFLPYFEALNLRGYEVEYSFVSSSIIRATIRQNGHTWTFCDSSFLFNQGLDKIGEAIGLPKLKSSLSEYCPCGDKERCRAGRCPLGGGFNEAPLEKLIPYNERDCLIPFVAIERLIEIVESIGGEVRFTLASTALATFRKVFLRQDIPTSKVVNRAIHEAYIASRIESVTPIPRGGGGRLYDINSSFPFSMTMPLPGKLRADGWNRDLSEYCVAKVKIEVPEQYLPPLPVRGKKGGIYFPYGIWEGWYASPDIECLEEAGGRVLEVIEAYHFEPFNDFAEYVNTIYPMRAATDDPMWKYVLKILLNALYGKLGEREEKETRTYSPKYTKCPHSPRCDPSCVRLIRPGLYAIRETVDIPHQHLPIPIFTTARSRRWLWQYASRAEALAYMDTDGIASASEFAANPKALGALKFEGYYRKAHFFGPKAYAYEKSENGVDWRDVVRFKGMRNLTREEFDRVVIECEKLPQERFRGPRTALNPLPGEVASRGIGRETFLKGVSHVCTLCHAYLHDKDCPAHGRRFVKPRSLLRAKRDYSSDGSASRPWSYDELSQEW